MPRRKRESRARKPSLVSKNTDIKTQTDSYHLEQQSQTGDAKRTLYERFVRGEIDADAFRTGSAAFDRAGGC